MLPDDAYSGNATELTGKIDTFIDDLNTSSEKRGREQGLIHNWKREWNKGTLIYEKDPGSAGLVSIVKIN